MNGFSYQGAQWMLCAIADLQSIAAATVSDPSAHNKLLVNSAAIAGATMSDPSAQDELLVNSAAIAGATMSDPSAPDR